MKKYTITSEEYAYLCGEIQSLQNENNRLKGYIKGLKEQLRTLDVVGRSEPLKCDCGETEDVKIIPICKDCYNNGEW